jgi:hypothetical protein
MNLCVILNNYKEFVKIRFNWVATPHKIMRKIRLICDFEIIFLLCIPENLISQSEKDTDFLIG